MAQVDFSNAVLTPMLDRTASGSPTPPYLWGYMALYGVGDNNAPRFTPTDGSTTSIVNNYSYNLVFDELDNFVVQYSGIFATDGTEFCFFTRNIGWYKWKVTGISFHTGDTFSFRIKVQLT